MKKLLVSAMTVMASLSMQAQDIKLPAPNVNRSTMSVMQALNTRHSVRDYSSKELSQQELSDLCWAACGKSRDDDHRTAPTAMNRKEIRLYVFTAKAVYEYKAVENILAQVATGDHRDIVAASQKFASEAPVSLLMVIDYKLFGSSAEHAQMMCAVDAGIVSQNINLYCQAAGLATVTRGTMDSKAIKELLKLSDEQVPALNNPVGYPK
ncbi:MAG: SagB/ThcOx family dehydrogenase [Bacteroidaceae bacterium]|nr:SagB/ThcOx family dehydrogenase [Bacteroidaceae bacterium]